jgi:branched-chain amino acid transport system ATP-binding protein
MSAYTAPTPPDYAGALLLAKNVTMRFGGVTAVSDLTLALPQGAVAGIIGPNGAARPGPLTC